MHIINVGYRSTHYYVLADARPRGTGTIGFGASEGTVDEVRISKSVRYTGNFQPTERWKPDADTLALYHFDENAERTARVLDQTVSGGACVNDQNVVVASADPTCTGFAAVGNISRNRFRGPFGYDDPQAGAHYAADVARVAGKLTVAGTPPAGNLWRFSTIW